MSAIDQSTVHPILQKLFVLVAGFPADTLLAPDLAQQVATDGHWGSVAQVLNDYMAQQSQAVGGAVLVARVAHQGLGLVLSAGDAAAIAARVSSGQTTWADLVASVIVDLTGPLADTLSNRADAAEAFTSALLAQGKGGFYPGSTVVGAAQNLLAGVTANAGTVEEASSSLVQLVDHLGALGLSSHAADGYLSNATVFVDTNGNRQLDEGEFSTTTDAAGNFNISGDTATGNLVAFGGTDIMTGSAFQGVMTAPAGATVVNPFTTLIQELLSAGHVASAQAGSDLVKQALGLPAGLNLLNYDPIAVLASATATPQEKAEALDMQAMAVQVVNLITQASVSLAAGTGLDLLEAADFVLHAIGDALVAGELFLTDAASIEGVLVDAAESYLGDGLSAGILDAIGTIAQITAASNNAADDATTLTDLAKAAHVAQEGVPQALEDAISGGGSLDQVLGDFSGANLAAAIAAATVGDLIPGMPVGGGGGTPPVPLITSDGGGDTASLSVAENSTAVTTVTASDSNPDAILTYSITGGADAGKFHIDASTGVLSFVAAPNFESPGDAGTNNVYDVVVQVSDGVFSDSQAIAVTVTNVSEDTTRPTSAIVVADNALMIGESSLVTITFSERVVAFDNTDLTVAGGTLTPVSSADDGVTWTATFTPTAGLESSSNAIVLANTGVKDHAGNAGTGTTNSNNYAIDTLRPTASIVVTDTALAVGETSLVTITFSEAVTGFDNSDLTIANGTLSAVASGDGGITWTATFTPTASLEDTSNVITLANTGVADGAGNAGTGTTNSNNYAIDTLAPTIAITTPISGGYVNNAEDESALAISGTTSGAADGQTVTVNVGGVDYTTTVSSNAWSVNVGSAALKLLAEGTVNVTADVSDVAGNPATQATASYVYDITAPTIAITTPISGGYVNNAEDESALAISGTTSGAADGQTVTVNVGGVDYTTTVSSNAWSVNVGSAALKLLAEGTVNVTADVSDVAGNPATQATASYVYDITAPTIAITTPISGGYVNNAEDESALAISGTTSGAADGQTVTVNVGGVDYTTTVSSNAWSVNVGSAALKLLAEGTVNVTADVSDVAGNPATQATASYVYDITAPTIAITTPISGGYVNNAEDESALAISGTTSGAADGQTVTVNVGGVDYTTTVSSNAWSVNVGSAALKLLAEGTVNVTADVSDVAGNPATQATASYVYDITAPTIAITTPISGGYVNNAEDESALAISGTTSGAADGQTVTVNVGGVDYTTTVSSNAWSVNVGSAALKLLAEGTVNVTADVSDVAGNPATQATASYVYDITAPTIAITTPISGGYVNNAEDESALAISGTTSGAADGQTVTVNVGGVDYTTTVSSNAWSVNVGSAALKLLAEGTVNVTADVSDVAGNPATQATASYVYDITAPTIAITTPISGGYVNNAEDESALAISGTTSGAADGQTVTVNVGGVDYTTTVSSNAWSVNVGSAALKLLAEGTVNVTADVSDVAGNPATQATASYVYDITAPTIAITTPISGGYVNNAEDESALAISGTTSGAADGQTVTVNVGGVDYTTTVSSNAWSVNVGSAALKLLAEGTVNVTADVSDVAGNPATQATASYVYDITAPTIAITTPISGGYVNNAEDESALAISGTTSGAADGQTVTVNVGGVDYTTTVSSNAWSVNVGSAALKLLAEGTVNVTADVSDVAGNPATQATASYVYDITAPTIAITTPISGGYVNNAEDESALAISGTTSGAADGQTVTVNVGGVDYTTTVSSNAWSVNVGSAALKLLAEGTVNVTADVSDVAGNPATQATASYVYDITAPTIAITTPISGGYVNNAEDESALAISGTTSGAADGQTVTVNVGGVDYTTTVSSNAWSVNVGSAALKLLAEGTVNVTADVSDVAGNPATQATASYVYDITAPTIAITTPISGGYVNNAEDESALAISGTTSGAADGQTVTVNVGGVDYTTTVSSNAWSVNVGSAALKLLAEGTVNVTADVSDVAGNPATQATASYVYDITAPTIAITTPISGGYVNNAEDESALAISGTTSGAADGQTVTVNVGGVDYTTTVSSNAWSVNVGSAALKLLAEGTVNVTADVSDVAGNPATQATASYVYDITAPTIAITTPISGGYVNNAEDESALAISGTTSGAADGQTVTVNVGGVDYTTTVSSNAWSVNVGSAALKLLAEGTVNVTADVSDVAGNPATQATASYVYDITAPTIAITTPISGGYVNNAEDESALAISGTTSGAADGQTVTVNVGGVDYTTTVSSNAWSVNVGSAALKLLAEGTVNVTADVSDVAGNPATQATASYVYDITAPTIAITTPISGGYVNNAEDESALAISGTTSGAADGQTVTVNVGGVDYTTTVSSNAWSVNVGSAALKLLAEGTVNVTADVSDVAGNPATQATASYVYDITAPTIAITTPISGGYVNNAEDESALAISGTTSGAADGQTVTVNVGGVDYTTTVSSNAWSVNVGSAALKLLAEGTVNVTADVSDVAGNPATQATASYVYDITAPSLSSSTPTRQRHRSGGRQQRRSHVQRDGGGGQRQYCYLRWGGYAHHCSW